MQLVQRLAELFAGCKGAVRPLYYGRTYRRPGVTVGYLNVYICCAAQTWSNHMAEAEEIRRTARPTGGPNPAHLGKAQTKYKSFDRQANTEYERLFAIDGKKKLSPTQHLVEHATFFHLCTLREGVESLLILIQILLVECCHIYLIKRFSEWHIYVSFACSCRPS